MERSWTKQTDRALLVRFFFGRDFDMQSQWTIKFAACTHRYEYIRHSINRKTNKEKHLKSETKMAKIKTKTKPTNQFDCMKKTLNLMLDFELLYPLCTIRFFLNSYPTRPGFLRISIWPDPVIKILGIRSDPIQSGFWSGIR